MWEVKCYINTHLCELTCDTAQLACRGTDTIHWKYLHLEIFTLTGGTAGQEQWSAFSTKLHLR